MTRKVRSGHRYTTTVGQFPGRKKLHKFYGSINRPDGFSTCSLIHMRDAVALRVLSEFETAQAAEQDELCRRCFSDSLRWMLREMYREMAARMQEEGGDVETR